MFAQMLIVFHHFHSNSFFSLNHSNFHTFPWFSQKTGFSIDHSILSISLIGWFENNKFLNSLDFKIFSELFYTNTMLPISEYNTLEIWPNLSSTHTSYILANCRLLLPSLDAGFTAEISIYFLIPVTSQNSCSRPC
jgi:hypothetical protein